MQRNQSSLHEFIFILALVLLFIAAFPYPFVPSPGWDPWRGRLIAAGLFLWALSTVF
jgi:hypothetical protein